MSSNYNGFGSGSRSAAVLLFFCIAACGERSASQASQDIRTALSDLAAAEDVYYATNLRYSADQAMIVSLTLPRGVALTIESADEHGWRAAASHEFAIETCYQSGRNDGNSTLAVVEEPNCKALGVTTIQQDVRGRKVAAATPVKAEVPAPAVAAAPAVGSPTAHMDVVPFDAGISLLLPAVGEQTDASGYPAQTIDQLAVRRLLLARSYDALDRVLTAYADSVLRDYRLEYRLVNAYSAFAVAVPALEPLLTEWVHKRPKSAAALLARSAYYKASGWNARGTEYASETPGDQMERMRNFFRLSMADLGVALRLDPKSIIAYRQLMDLATSAGDTEACRRFMDQALALQPNSFLLRVAYMHNLVPRWGGSYEAMAAFAKESAPYAVRNPRIKFLKGFVDWDKGRIYESQGQKGDAIESYERALASGDFWLFHFDRGQYYSRADLNAEALEEFNKVLSQYPQNDEALSERATVEYELGRQSYGADKAEYYSQAFRDILMAAALDPADKDYQKDLAFYRKNIPEYEPPGSSNGY